MPRWHRLVLAVDIDRRPTEWSAILNRPGHPGPHTKETVIVMHCTRRLAIIAAGLGLSALTLGACGGSTSSANAPGATNAATPSTIAPTAQARLATCDDVENLAADYSAAASDTSGGQDSKVGADAQKLASDASATGDQTVIDGVNKALAAGRSADIPALTSALQASKLPLLATAPTADPMHQGCEHGPHAI